MNYVESNLRKEEQVVVRAKISWWTLVAPGLLALIAWVGAFVLMGKLNNMAKSTGTSGGSAQEALTYVLLILAFFLTIPLIKRALINATTHLAVTNKRVIGKVGVLKIDTIDYPVDKIDNVSYNAGFFGNLFKYATVQIGSVSGEKKQIGAIGNARDFKNSVTDAIEKHAEEARKAQAAEIAAAMGR